MFHFLDIEDKILHQQKDYDSLYSDSCFIVMVWNQTLNVSEACL